eukprot:m.384265 g.384265  ORF g.384265 m.384265 type:complete len:81 (-) comp131598_c0_seq1:44-286(-)
MEKKMCVCVVLVFPLFVYARASTFFDIRLVLSEHCEALTCTISMNDYLLMSTSTADTLRVSISCVLSGVPRDSQYLTIAL